MCFIPAFEKSKLSILKTYFSYTNKKWSPEEKYELVARVIAGDTITSVAYTVGINLSLIHI